MIYSNFKGKKISSLGFGCMRFPKIEGGEEVDVAKVEQIVDFAIKNGINYFDTAWVYHGGRSEPIMGEILSKYPRDSFYLASKFPGHDLSNIGKVEEIFEAQLKRCKVDYFDFYLFHSVTEENIEEYLNPKHNIYNYLVEQKKRGRIKHLGFSTHGSLETIKRFLDAYSTELEFCQLQINWLDWKYQSAKEKTELVRSYGLSVFVMEPVRGGRLCKLADSQNARLKALAPSRTLPEWAFRFIQGIDGVTVTLSGMSNMEQLTENVKTFSEFKPLTDEESRVLALIADEIIASKNLPCTSCRYCTEKCPSGLDIPKLIELFNETSSTGITVTAEKTINGDPKIGHPESCISCGACEQVCPQGIKISDMMQKFAKRLTED